MDLDQLSSLLEIYALIKKCQSGPNATGKVVVVVSGGRGGGGGEQLCLSMSWSMLLTLTGLLGQIKYPTINLMHVASPEC